MSDIVERLRREGCEYREQIEAADEIERLRAALEEISGATVDGASFVLIGAIARQALKGDAPDMPVSPRHRVLMLEVYVELLQERCAALQKLAYAPDGTEHRSMVFAYAAENARLREVLQKIASLELTGGAAANAAERVLREP
jgi:hypothetical protein